LTGGKDVSETTIRALRAILDNSVAIAYTWILLVEVATWQHRIKNWKLKLLHLVIG